MTATPLRLHCAAFGYGGRIPDRYTCDGGDVSPEVKWSHAPEGTQSMVLIVEDPDAPNGTFTHWVLFDLSPDVGGIAEGEAPDGAVGGRNDFHHSHWGGPCPPPNHGDHRYYFRLSAIDVSTLDLPSGAPVEEVRAAMQEHVLAEAEWMGLYARTTGGGAR